MSKEATPYQARVLAAPEACWLFLGGGKGGGKSTAAMMLIARHVEQWGSWAKPLIVRESYAALRDFETELTSLLYDAYSGSIQANKQEHVIRANNATIELGQLDDALAMKKYLGKSF